MGRRLHDGADCRPDAPAHTRLKGITALKPSASGSEIYGLNALSTGFEFLKYQVHAGGVYQASPTAWRAPSSIQIHCPSATCYANSGLVIDAVTGNVLVLLVERDAFTTVLVAPDIERGSSTRWRK